MTEKTLTLSERIERMHAEEERMRERQAVKREKRANRRAGMGVVAGLAVVASLAAGLKHDHDVDVNDTFQPERHLVHEWVRGKTPMVRPVVLVIKSDVHQRQTPAVLNGGREGVGAPIDNNADANDDPERVTVVTDPIVRVESSSFNNSSDALAGSTDGVKEWYGFTDPTNPVVAAEYEALQTEEEKATYLADRTIWVARDSRYVREESLRAFDDPMVGSSEPQDTVLTESGQLVVGGSDRPAGVARVIDASTATEVLAHTLRPAS